MGGIGPASARLALVVALAALCAPAGARAAPAADAEAPVLTVRAPQQAPAGSLTVTVAIADASGIAAAALYWRHRGETAWRLVDLQSSGDGYRGVLEMRTGIEMYVEAFDELGNGPGAAGSADRPLVIALAGQPDTALPIIHHTPPSAPEPGRAALDVYIRDDSKIFAPTLYWRPVGTASWISMTLAPASGDLFRAVVPTSQDFEYWIEAYDEEGNGPATDGSEKDPYRLSFKAGATAPAAARAGRPSAPQELRAEKRPAPAGAVAPPAEPAKKGTLRPLSYAAMGVGAAGLVAGTVFLAMAAGQAGDWRTATTDEAWRSARDATYSSVTAARVSYIAGGVLAGAGGVLFLATSF